MTRSKRRLSSFEGKRPGSCKRKRDENEMKWKSLKHTVTKTSFKRSSALTKDPTDLNSPYKRRTVTTRRRIKTVRTSRVKNDTPKGPKKVPSSKRKLCECFICSKQHYSTSTGSETKAHSEVMYFLLDKLLAPEGNERFETQSAVDFRTVLYICPRCLGLAKRAMCHHTEKTKLDEQLGTIQKYFKSQATNAIAIANSSDRDYTPTGSNIESYQSKLMRDVRQFISRGGSDDPDAPKPSLSQPKATMTGLSQLATPNTKKRPDFKIEAEVEDCASEFSLSCSSCRKVVRNVIETIVMKQDSEELAIKETKRRLDYDFTPYSKLKVQIEADADAQTKDADGETDPVQTAAAIDPSSIPDDTDPSKDWSKALQLQQSSTTRTQEYIESIVTRTPTLATTDDSEYIDPSTEIESPVTPTPTATGTMKSPEYVDLSSDEDDLKSQVSFCSSCDLFEISKWTPQRAKICSKESGFVVLKPSKVVKKLKEAVVLLEHLSPTYLKTVKPRAQSKPFKSTKKAHGTETRTTNPSLRCPTCHFKCRSALGLGVHISKANQHGGRPYMCQHQNCFKRFTSMFILEDHCRRIHEKEKLEWFCSICPKICVSQRGLKVHLERIHYKLTCNQCDKRYLLKEELKEHESISGHRRDVGFKCPYNCGKTYSCKASLTRHHRDNPCE